MSRGIRSSRTEFRRRLRRRCRFRRSRALEVANIYSCLRMVLAFWPVLFRERNEFLHAWISGGNQGNRAGRSRPLCSPIPVLEPDGGAVANSRRLAQALRSFKLCWPKLENIDGMRSQPRTFCLHARERSRRDAAELVVAIITQVALRRSADRRNRTKFQLRGQPPRPDWAALRNTPLAGLR